MNRFVLDTNILVSFLTDRNPEQQKQAALLFERAAAGDAVLKLHQTVLTEMVYVLRNLYGVERASQAAILADLLALPGIEPFHEVAWGQVLALWPEQIPDFSDAILATVAGTDPIATFDARFVRELRKLKKAFWQGE